MRITIILAILMIAFDTPARAITGSDFFTSNDIFAYDPSGTASACDVGTQTSLQGNENNEKTFMYFVQKNIGAKRAAGITGNFVLESGGGFVNPNSNQSNGGPGRGIAQWEVGGRWDSLQKFAKEKGKDERDLNLQLDFVWWELHHTEKNAYDHLMQQTTVDGATESFMLKYERPGEKALSDRIGYARDVYNKFASKVPNELQEGTAPETYKDPVEASNNININCGGIASNDIVAIAQGELGTMEKPIGCDSANSSQKGSCGPIDKYTDSHLEYWCADFVSWVYKQSGKPFTGGASGGWRIASVDSVEAWFRNFQNWQDNGPSANPAPGSVVVFHSSHVGIVEKVQGNNLVIISGNTSTANFRNGVAVDRDTIRDFRSNGNTKGFGTLK